MKNNKKNSEPKGENIKGDYNPTNRDFQRTEEETDSISNSEKENNKNTDKANTKPTKNKIN
ncbi:MAG: hypothetical protein ACR2FN_04055 [Chitinophagaceae bacterium]